MHLIGKPLVFYMSRKHFSNLFCIWVLTLPLGAVVALAACMWSLIVKEWQHVEVPVLLLMTSPPAGGSRTTVPLWESGPSVLQPEAIRVLANVPFYWTFTRIKHSHLRIPHIILYASCHR